MPPAPRRMRLSERHVEALRREIVDPGFQAVPGMRPTTEADYDEIVSTLIAQAPEEGFWVFAYGSLIWNPDFAFVEERLATARGWRRTFCLGWDYRWRGNRDAPGLMLALDRGGSCRGVAFRLPPDALEENLHRLVRREMSMIPSAFPPRWIGIETGDGHLKSLTFAMNRNSGRYVAGLPDDKLAEVLATAQGFRGSMTEYLFSTVRTLEERGIHDRYLWRLQALVAERIEAAQGWTA